MDRVRFGRALGYGARQAVKTLVAAADAATAESPASKGAASSPRATARTETVTRASAAEGAGRPAGTATAGVPRAGAVRAGAERAAEIPQGLRRGSRRFGEAAWKPVVRLSGVLWLEFTGVFFGIFAVFALSAVWRLRGDWQVTATNAAAHRTLLGALGMGLVFGYFCVSSFVRARRRERGR